MLGTLFVRVSKLILTQLFVLLHWPYLFLLASTKLCSSFTDKDFVILFPFRNNMLELAGVASGLMLDLSKKFRIFVVYNNRKA